MDKLTAIKIKYDDETYSDEIPISVLGENVEWDATHTLVDVLGSVDVDTTGTIQDQISQLFNEKVSATQLQDYVASQLNDIGANPAGSAVVVDSSLTISGAAADAKVVGDTLGAVRAQVSELDETKVNKTNIVQNIGDSETDIMSQKAVTEEVTAVKRDLARYDTVNNVSVTKNLVWQAGYIQSRTGQIMSSTKSQYALLPLYAGETVVVGTGGIMTTLGTTTADTLAVGDIVDPIHFNTVDAYETVSYTANTDMKIVICVNKTNYMINFTKALNVQNANDIVTIRADLDKKADGIESLYKDGILRVSITSGNERIEHRITDIIYPNKSFDLTGSIVDSQYSNGLARINLTDGIDLDNIVLSAFARAGNGSTTFCIYDNDDTLLFVGSNTNLGIQWSSSNKFIKDFTIPRSVIPDNASYMLVSFWKNTAITWEHPFIKYAVDQKEVIASSNVTIPTSEKAEYVGTEHFKITINKNVLPESGTAVEEYEDDGVIFLPSSYTKSGKPTRLVISCHGSGTVINENFNRESRSWNNFLITMGYAVLDVNGGVADSRHYNAPFAIQSYIKAYQYVVDKYNLYKEVFVLGASMGGLPAFTLAQLKTIPVKAVAGFCPVVDLYRQAWCQPWYSE